MEGLHCMLRRSIKRYRLLSSRLNKLCCSTHHQKGFISTLSSTNPKSLSIGNGLFQIKLTKLKHTNILYKRLINIDQSAKRFFSTQGFDKSDELLHVKERCMTENSHLDSHIDGCMSGIDRNKTESSIDVSGDGEVSVYPSADSSDGDGLVTDGESSSDSSSSSDGDSDLMSDGSSDDEDGRFIHAPHEIDDMKKEGFTSEEMIELIEQIGETEHNDHSDVDGEHLQNMNTDVVNDDSFISAPSRHFDESGVISFIDQEKRQSVSKDWSVEEIEDFVNITTEIVEELPWKPSISLERGCEGVFDIQELVQLLQTENIQDIVTLRVPADRNFGDYMVIGTAKSARHLSAVSQNINWIYKQRKHDRERYLKQEGKNDNTGWIALDMGNIILHLFLCGERELYDLETLWTVGSQYDTQSLQHDDPYALSVDDHPWLLELEQMKTGNK